MSSLRKNTKFALQSSLVAQLLPLLALPILTRKYLPEEFGIYALFVGGVTVASYTLSFRAEWTIPNLKKDCEVSNLINASMIFVLCCALVFSISAVVISSEKYDGSWLDIVKDFLPVFGMCMVLKSFESLACGAHIRKGDLRNVAAMRMIATTVTVASQILLGNYLVTLNGLVYGYFAGALVSMAYFYVKTKSFFSRIDVKSVRNGCRVAINNRKELLSSTLTSTTSTGLDALVPVAIGLNFSTSAVGAFSIANRLTLGPVVLVSSALGQSFWAEGVKLISSDKSRLKQLYIKLTICLFAFSLLCGFAIAVLASLVDELLGDEWELSGALLLALVPAFIGKLTANPLTHLVLHRKQHWRFYIESLQSILVLGVLFVLPQYVESLQFVCFSMSTVMMMFSVALVYLNLRCYQEN